MLASSIQVLNASKELFSFMTDTYVYVLLFTTGFHRFCEALGVHWDSYKTQTPELSAWVVTKVCMI